MRDNLLQKMSGAVDGAIFYFAFQHKQIFNLIMNLNRRGALLRPLTPWECILKSTFLDQKGLLSNFYQLLISLKQVEDKAELHLGKSCTRIYSIRGMEEGYSPWN